MEIKTNDLRIGNLINDDNVVIKITRDNVVCLFRGQYYNTFESDEISGIPLTEELLLKMGFSTLNGDATFAMFVLKPTAYSIILCLTDMDKYDLKQGEWMCVATKTKLKYVHQLQNLYHALTGQELTLS